MKKDIKIFGKIFKASAVVMLAMLTACEQKELCYDHSHVVDLDIDFDWSHDPEASPESMMLYFFPKDGGKPLQYEMAGCQGGTIRIQTGEYDVISLNSDTHNITLTETDSEYSFTITAKDEDTNSPLGNMPGRSSSSLPLHEGTEEERVVMEGEEMWEATLQGLVITQTTPEENAAHTHRHATLTPEKVTDTYHIIVRNIENIEDLRKLTGSISGMAGGFNAASHHTTEEEVIIPFSLDFYREDTHAETTVVSFGSSISPIHGHYLELYATMSDGRTYYYDFDVSEQIDHPTGEGHDHYIIIDMLSPDMGEPTGENDEPHDPVEEEGGDGGFNVSVDEWDDPTSITFNM